MMECVCADGSSIPPLIIFKGENLNCRWIPTNSSKDWLPFESWQSQCKGACAMCLTRKNNTRETKVDVCVPIGTSGREISGQVAQNVSPFGANYVSVADDRL